MEIVSALIGAIATLLAVFISHWLTNRKTKQEKQKRIGKEVILYDGRKGMNGYDLRAKFDPYDLQQNIILVQSKDWTTYELQTYIADGKETTFIPKNELISGYRKFHASCEAKVINASYRLAIYLWETPEPEDGSDPSIDDIDVTITHIEWTKKDFYFRAPPDKSYVVCISTERISGEGSIQIKNLVVAERVS